jgi:hypothetical protein
MSDSTYLLMRVASRETRLVGRGERGLLPRPASSVSEERRIKCNDGDSYWGRVAFVLSPGVHCSGDRHFGYISRRCQDGLRSNGAHIAKCKHELSIPMRVPRIAELEMESRIPSPFLYYDMTNKI